ncbi:MAG: hypothetical protein H0W61_00835 [Bacteroidetes bacterium]|nr:hypothetical protein [Bacteroidota bacterium]
METNKRAFFILQMLVASAVIIFMLEKKLLISESRGATLSNYQNVNEVDKVILLMEDFEGLSKPDSIALGDSLLKANGFFSFGSTQIELNHDKIDKNPMASKTALKVNWLSTEGYGGWGKGVGANIELDTLTDHLTFRIYVPQSNGEEEKIKVILEEDDNENGKLEKEADDTFFAHITVKPSDKWQIISIPLKDFKDENPGGDKILNVTRKGGLHNVIFVFEQPDRYTKDHHWYFDFICFTNDKMIDSNILK